MTDKEYRQEVLRVQKLFNKWYKVLGLNTWDVDQYYNRTENLDHPTFLATTNSRWEYKRVAFNWYLPVTMDVNDWQLELHIVHEMVHPLLNSLDDRDNEDFDHQKLEFATQLIAQSMIWAREAGQKDA